MTVNQCNFERITRSLRKVRTSEAGPSSRQARQDIALASLGFSTLGELEDAIEEAKESGSGGKESGSAGKKFR